MKKNENQQWKPNKIQFDFTSLAGQLGNVIKGKTANMLSECFHSESIGNNWAHLVFFFFFFCNNLDFAIAENTITVMTCQNLRKQQFNTNI
jgi:hypothetical protein